MSRILSLSFAVAALAASAFAHATEIGGSDVSLNGAAFVGCTVIRENVAGELGSLNVYCPDVSAPGYAVPPEPFKRGWHVYVTDGINVREGHNCYVDHIRTLGGLDSYTFLCSS